MSNFRVRQQESQDASLRYRTRSLIARFSEEERGTIAILFALLLVPLLGIVFGGIDYSRAMSVQSQLQTAAESAARSAASRLPEGRDAAEAAFEAAFRANLPDELKDHAYDLNVAANGRAIEVSIKSEVRTTLVALVGLNKLEVAVAAKAKLPSPSKLARRKEFKEALDAVPGPAGARARARYEDALRKGGRNAAMPTPEELEQAQAKMREAMRALGVHVGSGSMQDLPDPGEIERMQREIARELGRLVSR
ncbi:MAG: pilus assembly protein TadG-related protein [Filomicrobium sp.]